MEKKRKKKLQKELNVCYFVAWQDKFNQFYNNFVKEQRKGKKKLYHSNLALL